MKNKSRTKNSHPKKSYRIRKRGFTLVELMVVISIIAILATIGLTVFSATQKDSRDTKKIADIKAIGTAYEVYYDIVSGYSKLTPDQFASGSLPTPPEGGSYNFVSGPDSVSSAICNPVKICAPIKGNSSPCYSSSSTCTCYTALQGDRDCLSAATAASAAAPPPPPPAPAPPAPVPPAPIPPAPVPPAPVPPAGPPAIPSSNTYHRVFITSNDTNGNLNGVSGADNICSSAASSASLNGTWKAWISDDSKSPASTFSSGNSYRSKPFKLLNGTVIADNWSELTGGFLENPINITEQNLTRSSYVWSNTNNIGATVFSTVLTCNKWKSNSILNQGAVGNSDYTNSFWTNIGTGTCDKAKALYCFEQ